MSSQFPAPGRHQCPAPGCEYHIVNSMLACRQHWAMVSPSTKAAVNEAFKRCVQSPASQELRGALAAVQQQAIREMSHKVKVRAEKARQTELSI